MRGQDRHRDPFPGGAPTGVPVAAVPPDLLAERLAQRFAGVESLLVAFSGGADSALVVAAAARFLGPDRVVAATAVSPSLASGELAGARRVADHLGVRHLAARTSELSRPGYAANGADRCYFCKSELMSVLLPLAARLGVSGVATGTNADDLVAGFRPGIRAGREAGALTPLADAGLTKSDVRRLSGHWGVPTARKPAAACLSSRIAYGIEITPARLARVDAAESAVRAALGEHRLEPSDLRVRDLGGGAARLELDGTVLAAAAGAPLDAARAAVAATGYGAVTVAPFRSGSMNDALSAAGSRPVPGLS